MKRIDAIIQPHKFEDVREALENIGVGGLTVFDVRGHGRQKGHKEIYHGVEYQIDLLPKVKIEVVIPDSRLDETVEEAIRIRNEERGEAALS